jgi:hypothetical protein
VCVCERVLFQCLYINYYFLDRTIIKQLIDATELANRLIETQPTKQQRDEEAIWQWLAYVLIYEMLFGKKKIQGGGYVQVC